MFIEKKDAKSFIIGTVLGDSSLCGRKNKYFFTGHSIDQEGLVDLKSKVLSKFYPVSITSNISKFKSGYSVNTRTDFKKMWTTSHHKLTAIYKLIYDENGKKTINEKTLKYFNEVSLAVLFMDDGCKETAWNRAKTIKTIRAFKISLGSFSVKEVELLQDHIYKTFNIETKLYMEKRKYPCLKITTKENREKFVNLIEPYIENSVKYKIYL